MVVVCHHVDPVCNARDLRRLEVGNFPRSGGGGDRELVAASLALAQRVQLVAELAEQQCVGARVVRPVPILGQPARHRKLPVDVDPVEHARKAAQEQVDCACYEPSAPFGRRRDVREVLRPSPPAERDQHAQAREALLQQPQLCEIAAGCDLRSLADAALADVKAGVSEHRPPIRRDAAEGIQDVAQGVDVGEHHRDDAARRVPASAGAGRRHAAQHHDRGRSRGTRARCAAGPAKQRRARPAMWRSHHD